LLTVERERGWTALTPRSSRPTDSSLTAVTPIADRSVVEKSQAPQLVAEQVDLDARGVEPSVVATGWGRRDALTRRGLATADLVGLIAALAIASIVVGIREPALQLALVGVVTSPLWLLVFKLYGLYDRDIKRISHATLEDLPWLFHALLITGLGVWACTKLFPVAPMILAEGVAFGAAAIIVISLLRAFVRRNVLKLLGPERVLIAAVGTMTAPLLRKIAHNPRYGLDPIGFVTPDPDDGARRLGLPVLGSAGNLRTTASTYAAERVVICREDFSEEQVLDMIQVGRSLSIKVSLLPDVVEALGPSVEIDEVEGIPILGVNPPVLGRTSRMIKRGFDLIVAGLLFCLMLPVMAVVALAIRLDSPGPVLFRQERIGRGGRCFELLKFRTMVVDAEERRDQLLGDSSDPNWLLLENDPRVTKVGRRLRQTSLDELPQLWNVLGGAMSLVGPRPLIAEEDRRVDGWMRGRLDLMPGITGLWQVLGRTSIPFEEMVKLDYLYVTNWSLWFDIRLLIRTLPVVFSRRGAN
jgi:exopolysaccharide biosynthesis polyprenyl glycosylphosphotransferase